MGVLSVYARWKIYDTAAGTDLHQFFYIDCEEAGLETYKSVIGNDQEKITCIEQAVMAGLGAKKMDITQSQLTGLLTYYKKFNEQHGLPLPDNYREYSFLLEPETIMTPDEEAELMHIMCSDIVSDYQAVNYFLMRCFGRDHRGAAFLAAADVPLDIYDRYNQATFCKNVIDIERTYDDGAVSYLCESLI